MVPFTMLVFWAPIDPQPYALCKAVLQANAWAVLDPSTARFDTSKPVASLGVGEEVILRRGNLAKVSGLAEVLQ